MSAHAIAALLPSALRARAGDVLPAIEAAAQRTGVDFNTLFHTARLESGFDPEARARTSSATGLFQFIDSTWLSTLARHGPAHGIAPAGRGEALALRRDPWVASLMAAEHMADNAERLERTLGRPLSGLDLYFAHFLGPGGAARFLTQLTETPDRIAAELMPAAAAANRAIFYDRGTPRTLQEVHALFARRLGLDTAAAPAPAADRSGWPPARIAAASLAAPPSGPAAPDSPAALPHPGLPSPAAAARLAFLLLADMGA